MTGRMFLTNKTMDTPIQFLIIADESFYKTVYLNCYAIRKFHGDDMIIRIVDIGLTQDQRQELEKNFSVIIDRFNNLETKESTFVMILKPLALLQLQRSQVMTVYMDADAILVQKLPFNKMEDRISIIATNRVSDHGRINSGVFFMNGCQRGFLTSWLRRAIYLMSTGFGKLSEQQAFIDIVDEGFYNVQEVSCDQFNFPAIEKGITDDVYIVHLKSRRRFRQKFIDQVQNHIDR